MPESSILTPQQRLVRAGQSEGNEAAAKSIVGPEASPHDPVLSGPALRGASWQAELREAVRDPSELCRRLGLPASLAAGAGDAAAGFPVFVPPAYLARIAPGDPRDPLLRQVLPVAAEGEPVAGFGADPVGDEVARQQPGLLQKYSGRALLVTTGACAVHCRYCFRRHFPYEESPHADAAWEPALAAIAADVTLHEVILSGGDPLMLVDPRLTRLTKRIAAIPHVSRLRVHTRLPIMVPARVTDELLAWLAGGRLSPVVVIHANHVNEIDDAVVAALDRLRRAGVVLLNQSVLLAGVNDSVDALCDLSERLVTAGVTPYYLHQLDRVAGAAHFEVPEDHGRAIIDDMQRRLPGYMVPRYVREVAGAASKMPIA
ncbi:MAG: EF-P beta-lysylation protein EpmB [Planctomycetaceae bacterium]|nr:EF-P beta-lysylation protein EpmB [Planctomycetaceae bacterium]